jgi:mannose-6-phosphate isomerase class I
MDIINEVPSDYLEVQFIKPLANNFMFKYLDAREDLSIQVHPNIGKRAQFEKEKTDERHAS